MQPLTCTEILEATGGTLVSGNPMEIFTGVSTDSRKIRPGDLFVPLIGQRFDGHRYIGDTFSAGALGAVTQEEQTLPGEKAVIRVDNTLKALGDIAGFYRRKFTVPFTAITGSVGKTSTKDMISCVLGRKFRVLKTEGNFNNEIGLPLTLLNLCDMHQAAVVEMGMSGFGEISRLTAMARPRIAVITNIGLAHIEKLGSRENILKAKLEILEGLDKDGLVVLNGDDELLSGLKGQLGFRTVFFGTEEGSDYRAYNIRVLGESGSYFDVTVSEKEYRVFVPSPGIHNVYNALAAIAAGMELGVPVEEAVLGIAAFEPGKMRLNITSNGRWKVINDAYNASPQSMEAAISVLKDMESGGRRIAVLGDMLEMGEWARDAHYGVGRFAASRGIDCIVAVGENGIHIIRGARDAGLPGECLQAFRTNEEAIRFLQEFAGQGDVLLVKGSRGMKMEEIVQSLLNG